MFLGDIPRHPRKFPAIGQGPQCLPAADRHRPDGRRRLRRRPEGEMMA